ncbi:DUF411 domain-containing protein [Sphingomonas daechungensis]|uniref:DUF411 domain-containing protein n=1 Tax=Sphingomonas daechungensis TaxID=1176646 RepID=UPI003783C599
MRETDMLNRRLFIVGLMVTFAGCASAANAVVVHVYKTATCGCCAEWVVHLRSHGFEVLVKDVEDVTPVAEQLGVPSNLRSCHTALVSGYFVEGHVPSADIRKLLKEKPKAIGIAVPGMPAGSPGMDLVGQSEAYNTMLVDRRGGVRLFVAHSGNRS